MDGQLNPVNYLIAVDFDGTCVTHEYPKVGVDIGAAPVLKELVENGHKLVLYTMRSGETLLDALEWFKFNEIPIERCETVIENQTWTQSPKLYAQLYIDDAALGCPLLTSEKIERPYVDWLVVRNWLVRHNYIREKRFTEEDLRNQLSFLTNAYERLISEELSELASFASTH